MERHKAGEDETHALGRDGIMKDEKKAGRSLINRRDFNRTAAAGATILGTAPLTRAFAKGPSYGVSLAGVKNGSGEEEIAKAVREAATAATDFSWLSRGDRVMIKPVLNSGNPYPATTSPAGLAAMIKLLKDKGAGEVLVTDMSGIEHVKLSPDKLKGSSRELMHQSGMAKAAISAGATLYFPEEEGWDAFFEDAVSPGKSWTGGVMMPKKIRDMDHVGLMPRCSRHLLAGVTLGMKAAVGWWRTDTRLEYHKDAATFHKKTAEANWCDSLVEKQRLALTVADKIQTTFGPDQGHSMEPEVGLVFASESITAHDMVSLSWFMAAREMTPEKEKSGIAKDPYQNASLVKAGNRGVVMMLGGARDAVKAETLERYDIDSVADDKVLARAYEIEGGMPEVELMESNEKAAELSETLKGRLPA